MIKDKEIWFNIPGFEGLYQFSNKLKVKRLLGKHCKKERIIKCYLMKNGYYIFSLWKNNKEYKKYVHDLVLEIIMKQKKLPDQQCRHLDGNKLNNNPKNLKIGTAQEDANDRIRHDTIIKGSKQWRAKLNEKQVRIIKQLIKAKKLYQKDIAKIFGVNKQTINDIKMGKTWKHIII